MYLITMFIKTLKTSKNKTERLTHATSNLGKGVEFKNGFVLAEKSNNRKINNY